MKKFLKISAIILAAIMAALLGLAAAYFCITKDVRLQNDKLQSGDIKISLYDFEGREIALASLLTKRKNVNISELPEHTVRAFIASEDRTFYTHNGLNLKRMIKAAYKNVVSRSFKEGASTISQQLIKNTHLTNEKTITRKLKEIRLTGMLEKRFSKDDILQMYLNTIYFGHNCYGLESAAEFYFDKKARDLTLPESATLAGLISSPNNYSPFKHPEKSLKRRNTVLKCMRDCGYINGDEYTRAAGAPIGAKQGKSIGNDYVSAVFDELGETGLDYYSLAEGCKIYTNLNGELQNALEKLNETTGNAAIVTDNRGKVLAFKSTVGVARRQPGSAIKPLAVYAPAIEEKIISPYTKISDEKIEYNGYSPENADGKYHGYVSAAESLKMSYNIPAVKILNTLKPDVAEKYLNKMNIKLNDGDKNLSLALGGMTCGVTLKELADGYSVFANKGVFTPSTFINKIVDKNNVTVYRAEEVKERVFSEGTASLTADMLIETSKSGTAKKLKNLPYQVAAKTGTCGTDEGNTDAYAICTTTEHTVGVWLGDKDNKKIKITGGGNCCPIAIKILDTLYKTDPPRPFDTDSGTETIEIDADDYNNLNKAVLADKNSPKFNVLKVKVLRGNLPKEISTKFTEPLICMPTIFMEKNTVNIELCVTKYYEYDVYRQQNGQKTLIYSGKWKKSITDAPPSGTWVYSVIAKYTNGNNTFYGREIALPPVLCEGDKSGPQVKIPNIINDDWFNL